MKVSVKSDYAVRAVLSLARRSVNGQVTKVQDLADENKIPANYLIQILIELKTHQIVKSLRGKKGGYVLGRPPSAISIIDILRCIHGSLFIVPPQPQPPGPGDSKPHPAWEKLRSAIEDAGSKITLDTLLDSPDTPAEGVLEMKTLAAA